MIQKISVSDFFTVNTYFVIDEISQSGFIIDPGAQGELLLQVIEQQQWQIEKILLTHGHFDHTGAVDFLREKLGINAYAHPKAQSYLLNPYFNLSRQCVGGRIIQNVLPFGSDRILLKNNPQFYLDIRHTPGHSPDSVSFYAARDKALIAGDTIYQGGLGLTHFPGGQLSELKKSIQKVIFSYDGSVHIYSGHSQPLTVAALKSKNIFFAK
ncbi:MBL fold metallo-hydrolase [Streptococcus sp. H49]|uniref:MBL fold metallo-hydrolase n=1 Tax=Streptococcus huangxiaojuni TaxID=3237239 RepID=UPI0034A5697C